MTELTAKRIEIMDDLIPGLSRIALLDNMENASVPAQWNELKRAALAFGIQPLLCDVKKPEDIEMRSKKQGMNTPMRCPSETIPLSLRVDTRLLNWLRKIGCRRSMPIPKI